jgi:hypothetical protein
MKQTRTQDISIKTQTGSAPANEAAALPVRPGRAFGGGLLPKKCLLLAVTALGGLLTAVNPSFAQSIYTPYTFTTLAGVGPGSADGTGSAARFNYPFGAAVDSAGNVYVGDDNNGTIRKVTPAGVVTTLAGLAGSFGSADGTGSAARFQFPRGVAVDSATNVYVADVNNFTIRKVTPAGVVTTLAGLAGSSGSANGTGSAARFYYPDRPRVLGESGR